MQSDAFQILADPTRRGILEALRHGERPVMGWPTSHPTHATFTELELHERLTLTHLIDFIPGVTPYESTARVEFSRAGEQVRMAITLDAMHSEEWTNMATMGWTSQLTKLDKRLGTT